MFEYVNVGKMTSNRAKISKLGQFKTTLSI